MDRNFMQSDRLENILLLLNEMNRQEIRNSIYQSKFMQNFLPIGSSHLGAGSFGFVYLVEKPINSGNPYDVINFKTPEISFQKRFALKLIPNFDDLEAYKEVLALSSLIHPNIARCYQVWMENPTNSLPKEFKIIEKMILLSLKYERIHSSAQKTTSSVETEEKLAREPGFLNTCLFLQYEFCPGGTLADLLDFRDKNNQDCLSSQEIYAETKDLIMQFIEGLVYLEFKQIIHHDLKPNNIFLEKEKNGSRLRLKIGDFGLGIINSKNDLNLKEQSDCNLNSFLDDRRPFVPPEYSKNIYTHEGDMYSFGLILLAMLVPVQDECERFKLVLNAMIPLRIRKPFPSDFLDNFKLESQWIDKLISHDISERPTASQLKRIALAASYNESKNKSDLNSNSDSNKISNCLLPFLTDIMNKGSNVESYKYGQELFYDILPILNVDKTSQEHVFEIRTRLTYSGLTLGETEESFYRDLYFLSYLEEVLGQDNLTILSFQIEVQKNITMYLSEYKSKDLKDQARSSNTILNELQYIYEELSSKIENSSAFTELEEQDPIRLEYALTQCIEIDFSSKSSPEILESNLIKISRVVDFYKNKIIENKGNLNNTNFTLSLSRKARILKKLDRNNEAEEVYSEIIQEFCENPELTISNFTTIELIYSFVEFLIFEGNNYIKARSYSETFCEKISALEPKSDYYHSYINALGQLAMIYYNLGFQDELDFILVFLYHDLVNTKMISNVDATGQLGLQTNDDKVKAIAIRNVLKLYDQDKLFQSGLNYLNSNSDYESKIHSSISESALKFRHFVHDEMKRIRAEYPEKKFHMYAKKDV